MMTEKQSKGGKSLAGSLFTVLKVGIALFIAFPFIVVLFPLWYVYRWNEVREGRPEPEAPWGVLLSSHLGGAGGRGKRVGGSSRLRYLDEGEAEKGGQSSQDDKYGQDAPSGGHPNSRREGLSDRGSGALQEGVGQKREGVVGKSLEQGLPVVGTGRVALVTGGGRRLGAEMALMLAQMGFKVGIAYHRSRDLAEEVVDRIRERGGVAECLALDLTNPARIERFLNESERKLGPAALLVNNAALFRPTQPDGGSWEGLEQMFKVNLQGPLWLSFKVGAKMVERVGEGDGESGAGGMIVNVGDIWGERPLKDHAVYSSAKAGLIMATRALARDLAPDVTVNAIAPGAVLPPDDPSDGAGFQQMLNRTPLARHASPEAVLQALRYLLAAPYVTGEVLRVDGGRNLV
ncbi:MAG: SDR family NAD(P)-dependent oxidoreductase [Magnetococcales bacterium]|nr:SDR family NAD(P)-dependent oxidoreductase [Magnetococcales bacterium]